MHVTIADKVKNKKIMAYDKPLYDDPWDEERYVMPDKVIDTKFNWIDTLFAQNIETGYWDTVTVNRQLPFSELSGMMFFESWSFDFSTLHFEKNIRSVAPLWVRIDKNTGETRGLLPFFNVDLPQGKITDMKYLISKDVASSVQINFDFANASTDYSYDGSTIAISWDESWQYNLYQEQYYPLVQGIINGVYSGKIKALDPVTKKPMKKDEVSQKLNSLKDSTFVQPGDLPTDYTLINRIKFTEDWYFNPETVQFYKKVTAITLVNAKRFYNEATFNYYYKETELFTILLK